MSKPADSDSYITPEVAASLIGGYYVARTTKVRALGGAVLAAGGLVAWFALRTAEHAVVVPDAETEDAAPVLV